MVSITLSVSEETRELMKRFPEVNWSALVRKTIEERTKLLLFRESLLKDLEKEKPINDWAVEVIRRGRKK